MASAAGTTMASSFVGASLGRRASFHGTSVRVPKVARAYSGPSMAFELQPPPYGLDALEPHISKRTLEFHWGKHHRAYVNNLNKQIEGTELEKKSLAEVVKTGWNGGSPKPFFNNAGQIWNHDFYWTSISPSGGGKPSGDLLKAIQKDFGSFEKLLEQLKAAAATQFGSGWAWLVLKPDGKLAIEKTANAESPFASGSGVPLLTIDVWEHAYYLDYQNLRPTYIDTFFSKLINWDAASKIYAEAK